AVFFVPFRRDPHDIGYAVARSSSHTLKNRVTAQASKRARPAGWFLFLAITSAVLLSGCSGGGGGGSGTGSSSAASTSSTGFQISSITTKAGPVDGGSIVEIHGSGFDGVITVDIGGQPATDVQVNDDHTIIICRAPRASKIGPADIVVTSSTQG